jgi:hypothetical protein
MDRGEQEGQPMTGWTHCGLWVGLILTLAGGQAEEKGERYTLQLKEPAAGDVASVTQSFSGENRTKLREVEKVEKMTASSTCRETILDRKGKEPERLKRHYQKARATRGDQPQNPPYEGKTVLVEKKDGKYRFSVEGGDELKDEDARWLDKEFNQRFHPGLRLGKLLLPAKAVRVGKEWPLDKERLLKLLLPASGLKLDLKQTKATAKLVRVYTKEKARFGVLNFHLEAPATQLSESGFTFDVAAGSKITADGTLDLCIDGTQASGTSKVTVAVKLITPIKATGATVYGDARSVTEETRTELPRK